MHRHHGFPHFPGTTGALAYMRERKASFLLLYTSCLRAHSLSWLPARRPGTKFLTKKMDLRWILLQLFPFHPARQKRKVHSHRNPRIMHIYIEAHGKLQCARLQCQISISSRDIRGYTREQKFYHWSRWKINNAQVYRGCGSHIPMMLRPVYFCPWFFQRKTPLNAGVRARATSIKRNCDYTYICYL